MLVQWRPTVVDGGLSLQQHCFRWGWSCNNGLICSIRCVLYIQEMNIIQRGGGRFVSKIWSKITFFEGLFRGFLSFSGYGRTGLFRSFSFFCVFQIDYCHSKYWLKWYIFVSLASIKKTSCIYSPARPQDSKSNQIKSNQIYTYIAPPLEKLIKALYTITSTLWFSTVFLTEERTE